MAGKKKAALDFTDLPWLRDKARAFQALTNEEKQALLAIEGYPTDSLLRAVVSYVRADAEAEKADAIVEAIPLNDKTSSGLGKGYTREEFDAALEKASHAHLVLVRTVDAWKATAALVLANEEHAANPANSNVPKEDAKTLIAEALAESAAELQWNLKSGGLVAHKLSEAVYGYVVREESQEAPLCPACL